MMKRNRMKQLVALVLLLTMMLSTITVQAAGGSLIVERVLINDSCNSLKAGGWTSAATLTPLKGTHIIDSLLSYGNPNNIELPAVNPGVYRLYADRTIDTNKYTAMSHTADIGTGAWTLSVDMDIRSLITASANKGVRGICFDINADKKRFQISFSEGNKLRAINGGGTNNFLEQTFEFPADGIYHKWSFTFDGTDILIVKMDGETAAVFQNAFIAGGDSDTVKIINASINAVSGYNEVYIDHIKLVKHMEVPSIPERVLVFVDDCSSFEAAGWDVSIPQEGLWAADSAKTMGDPGNYVEENAHAGEYFLYADYRAGDNFGRRTMGNPMAVMHKKVEMGPGGWEFRFNAKLEDLIKPINFVAFRGLYFDIIADGKYYKLTFQDQNKILGIISEGYAYQQKQVEMPNDGQFHWWSIGFDGIGTVYITLDGVRIASFENMGFPAAKGLLPPGLSTDGDSITIVNNSTDWRQGENRVIFTDLELWRTPSGDSFTVLEDECDMLVDSVFTTTSPSGIVYVTDNGHSTGWAEGLEAPDGGQYLLHAKSGETGTAGLWATANLEEQNWYAELDMTLYALQEAATNQDAGLKAEAVAGGRSYELALAGGGLWLDGEPVALDVPLDGKPHKWGLAKNGAGVLTLALDGNKMAVLLANGRETALADGLYLSVSGNGTGETKATVDSIKAVRSAIPEWAQYNPAFLGCSVYPEGNRLTAVISLFDINHSWLNNPYVQLRGTVFDETGVQLAQTMLQPAAAVVNMTLSGLEQAGRQRLVVELVSGGNTVAAVERRYETGTQSLELLPGDTATSEEGRVYTFNKISTLRTETGTAAADAGWTMANLRYEGINTEGLVLENSGEGQRLKLPAKLHGWFRVHVGYVTGTQAFAVSGGGQTAEMVIEAPNEENSSGGAVTYAYGEKAMQETFAFAAEFNGDTVSLEPAGGSSARIAYIKLIGMSQEEIDLWQTPWESSMPGGGKRVTYSNDGYSDFYQGLYNTPEGLVKKTIDTYINQDVGSFDWMTGTTLLTNYNSTVAGMPFDGIPESAKSAMRAGDVKAMDNILKLIQENPDTNTLEILSERGEELGIKVNAAVRMAAYYSRAAYPGLAGWNNSLKFSTAPTDYRQTNENGAKTDTMSYYYAGFREFMKDLIVEAAGFEGVDGVTLDYCRYPYLMSGYEPELIVDYKARYGAGAYDDVIKKPVNAEQFQKFQADIITGFMREVHHAIKAQNSDTTILARVPKIIGEQKGFFDIPTWLDEGLVDVIIPSALGQEDLSDNKIVLNMVLAHNADASEEDRIAVWGGIESIMSGTDATKDEQELAKRGVKFTKVGTRVSSEQYQLRAKQMYDDGYDGIYIYNNWNGVDSLGLIGDKVKVNQWHAFEYPAAWVQNFVTVMDPAIYPPAPEEVEMYTVTFMVDDEIYDVQTVAVGREIQMPQAPEKEGYTFKGWYTEASGGTKITEFTNTRTVYAQWTQNPSVPSISYYTITASAGEGGKISPQTSSAAQNTSKTFTVTPDEGYEIADVAVDGKSVGAVTTYTFSNITGNHSISVTFKKIKTPEEPTTPEIENPFADVNENQWFYDCILYVYNHGLMSGVSEDKFSPLEKGSRGMIVTILHNLEGRPDAETSGFKDVESGKWYANAIAWAAENKIVSGYGNGLFGPNDNITREQMAVIFYHYAKHKGYDLSAASVSSALERFTDHGKVSDWAVEALQWMVESGMMSGKGNSIMDPKGTATRAEMASIMQKFMEKYSNK